MKKYVCTVCAWVYNPEVGDPDSGIAPGTPFEEIPDDWTCPICGVGKEDFSSALQVSVADRHNLHYGRSDHHHVQPV